MNLSLEQCMKLCDAGFPQDNKQWYWWNGTIPATLWTADRLAEKESGEDTEVFAAPILSELIEACGERFGDLERCVTGEWRASDEGYKEVHVEHTMEEAVAQLWLALNKKI